MKNSPYQPHRVDHHCLTWQDKQYPTKLLLESLITHSQLLHTQYHTALCLSLAKKYFSPDIIWRNLLDM